MKKQRLLLIDDDRLVLTTVCSGLRQAGYEVYGAASGDEGLHLAAEQQPDLALLDMRMNGLSGLDVARRLREDMDIPFMFLSAFGDDETVELATELGALGYLVKPLDISQLVPAIKAALRRAAEIRDMRDNEAHLSTALQTNRVINTAVGIVMERMRVDRKAALQILRERARSNRVKLISVADSILSAVELLSGKESFSG